MIYLYHVVSKNYSCTCAQYFAQFGAGLSLCNDLLQRAAEVEDPAAVQELIRDMTETLVDSGGIGLAAPQIHESLRIILVSVPKDRAAEGEPGSLHSDSESGAGGSEASWQSAAAWPASPNVTFNLQMKRRMSPGLAFQILSPGNVANLERKLPPEHGTPVV